jgi:hypothetical protein
MKKLFLLMLLLLPWYGFAAAPVARTVIALYDGKQDPDVADSLLLSMAEMPLNHLGLMLEYHDINQPLPDISNRTDVRGVITWYNDEPKIEDPRAYIAWAEKAVDDGKKFVILGKPGFYSDIKKGEISNEVINHFLNKIGLNRKDQWVSVTPGVRYDYLTPSLFIAKEPFKFIKPPYEKITVIDKAATTHLMVRETVSDGDDEGSALIVTGPRGSYVADEYLYHGNMAGKEEIRQWHIDPFMFFRLAFATDDLPKPDTTTIAGRRIYYSHIDGDGWNNYVHLEEYKDHPAISAQLLLDKVFRPHPDLPASVAVIAGDIDTKWAGTDYSRDIARQIFALPQIEAGTHTYSHPFVWDFFADGNWKKEEKYLQYYRYGSWNKTSNLMEKIFPSFAGQSGATDGKKLPIGYFIPRAYANEPFDIHKEIEGSVAEISKILPPGKKVKLLAWPGDCQPFEEALRLTREAGLANINGGDSRFDPEYPSYATVAALGRPVGKERQIYASASNENTYTNEWTRKFHNYQYLKYTLEHTESPVRVKPLNIYYHVFLVERLASLNALLKNLDYAEHQEIAPVAASHFSEITQGFYTTQMIPQGSSSWQVKGRGALNTIRFDNANAKTVNFAASAGVIGQRHYQGSLYVYLDEAAKEPLIALASRTAQEHEEEAPMPYLVNSRWPITNVTFKAPGFGFTAQGYGKGEMTWQVPSSGRYQLHLADGRTQEFQSNGRLLHFVIDDDAIAPHAYTILRKE